MAGRPCTMQRADSYQGSLQHLYRLYREKQALRRLLCQCVIASRLADDYGCTYRTYNEDSKLLHQAEIAIMPRGHNERLWAHLVNSGRFETPDSVRFEATRQGCTSAAADTGQVTPTFQTLVVLYRSICSTSSSSSSSLSLVVSSSLPSLVCPKLSHSLQPLEGSHRRPTS